MYTGIFYACKHVRQARDLVKKTLQEFYFAFTLTLTMMKIRIFGSKVSCGSGSGSASRALRSKYRSEPRPEDPTLLKGQCHEIFGFRFFHKSSSLKPLKITLRSFRVFFLNSRRYSPVKVHHRYTRHRWCTLSCEYFREFAQKNSKRHYSLMVYRTQSGACEKLIHEKNLKSKISWHCPFNLKSVWFFKCWLQTYLFHQKDLMLAAPNKHQNSKSDPDRHQNVADPPHCN